MKILQVIPCLGRGGAERLVLNLAHQLQLLDHEVMVVQLRPDVAYPELQELVNVKLANSNVYYSVFGKDSINTEEFDQIVDDFKPDIIHSHLLDSEFVSRNRPVPNTVYITHWHGCPSLTQPIPFSQWLSKESIWKWNTKRILRGKYRLTNTHFICISEFIGQYLQDRLSIQNSDLTVIHNAIDLELFKPINIPKNEGFRLINIGSLHKNKNHQFLFKVVNTLVGRGYSDIHLDVFGDGPEKNDLHQLVESMNLSNHVTLHGIVSNPEEHLNRSHLLVHSAWHEPFGLIFLEAMACGIPVVSFNTGGPAELISDGQTGYLVDKDELISFVERIERLYIDHALLDKLGAKGIEHASSFGLKQYTKKIEAVYHKHLGQIRQ